jgi:heme/copper-type cytochrome/quinol oxidase subunit 2
VGSNPILPLNALEYKRVTVQMEKKFYFVKLLESCREEWLRILAIRDYSLVVYVFGFCAFIYGVKNLEFSFFYFVTFFIKPFIYAINFLFIFLSLSFLKFYPFLFFILNGESLLEFFTFSVESVDDFVYLICSFFENDETSFFSGFFLKTLFFHKNDPFLNFFNLIDDFLLSLHPRGFQFPESYNMFLLIKTHNFIFGYCVFIFFFVSFFLVVTLCYYMTDEDHFLEKNIKGNPNYRFPFFQVEKFITGIINISFRGNKPRDIDELYFFQQYHSAVTGDSIFLEGIPFQNDFVSFFASNNIYLPFDRFYFIPRFDKNGTIHGETIRIGPHFLKPNVFTGANVGSLEIFKAIVASHKLLGKQVPTVFLSNPNQFESLVNSNLDIAKVLMDVHFPYTMQKDFIGYYWLLSDKSASVRARSHLWDNLAVEITWTLIPTLILIAIALPSFSLLYAFEPTVFYDSNTVFLKIIGHQWYWSYEFPNETFALLQRKGNFPESTEQSFSSYMLPISELKDNMPRLLSVDNPVYLPAKSNIIIRVTSDDVIHSWAIPSLGVKIDCIPGRINEFVFRIRSVGDLYGQCSELCGVNHGFMPIHIISYDIDSLG